ncbi:MAG: thiolase family protein [Syntrophaceae bacterium]|nr:thiolase family protein [Syntrophaceae bacterium]
MLNKVGIIGVAQSHFGEESGKSLEELIFQTCNEALVDAGITIDGVDGIVISSNDQVDGRPISIMVTAGSVGAYQRDLLDVPSSGEHALILGYMRVLSGNFETQLIASWSSLEADDLRTVQNITCEPIYQRQLGLHDITTNALQAAAYLSKYEGAAEGAAQVVVKNRTWGKKNPRSHLRKGVEAAEVSSSPYVCWPVRRLMVPPESSGVVALVIASEKKAKELDKRQVAWIEGVGWASDTYWMGERDLSRLTSLEEATIRAYQAAQIKDPMKEIDIAEIQEVTAYHELMSYEALLFCGPGEASRLILDGVTGSGGKLPVNLSGGTLSTNPYFASGLVRVAEAALQVMGKAGEHQLPGVQTGLAQTTSGFAGQNSATFILSNKY